MKTSQYDIAIAYSTSIRITELLVGLYLSDDASAIVPRRFSWGNTSSYVTLFPVVITICSVLKEDFGAVFNCNFPGIMGYFFCGNDQTDKAVISQAINGT